MNENFTICPPALIYIVFSITQIIIDMFKGLYNTALMKFFVMIVIGFLLNVLCLGGLSIISWIIVFIPFVLMTVIVAMLLYIFGLKSTTGKIDDTFILTTNGNSKPKPKPSPTPPPPCVSPPIPYRHGFSQNECLQREA
jgi:hypothetical protein